jgi:plastocyanin/heme-degrading monooxygenase HmoA
MEYVHTVLAQIAATRADNADRIIDEIEGHREFASSRRGFRGMRITRTARPEGDVLVVVETRWANINDMTDYAAGESAAEILGRHEDVLVPGSIQTHRMEAVSSETAEAPNRVYDRLALALFVPVGVLAFSLLTIYGFSRIYLARPQTGATIFAALLSLVILGLAFYFAMNPRVPRWQMAGVFVVGIAALAIGGTAGAIYDEEHKETHTVAPTAPPNGGEETPAAPGEAVIDMDDNFFVQEAITVASGTEIPVNNLGSAIHNVHVASADGTYAEAFCSTGGETPCSDPDTIPGGDSGVLLVDLPPGDYNFRCDFHVDEMNGVLTVQ